MASYRSDPGPAPAKTLGENAQADSWKPQPAYDWQPLAAGRDSRFITRRSTRDVFIAGPSSVDLYLRSNARNTDIQVTLTEGPPGRQNLRPERLAARLAPQS